MGTKRLSFPSPSILSWDVAVLSANRVTFFNGQDGGQPGTQTMHNLMRGSSFPSAMDHAFVKASVREYFDDLFLRTGFERSDVIRRAGVPMSLGHQIFNGVRGANRHYALRIALAMNLPLSEVQMLLVQTGNAALYPKVQSDAAWIFCINNSYSPLRADIFLSNLAAAQNGVIQPTAGQGFSTETAAKLLEQETFPGESYNGQPAPDIKSLFDSFIEGRGLKRSDVIARSNIPRAFAYQIMKGERKGRRDYVIALALAMRLGEGDIQHLLHASGHNQLHPKIKRDAAILFSVNHNYDLSQCWWFLQSLGLAPIDTGIN